MEKSSTSKRDSRPARRTIFFLKYRFWRRRRNKGLYVTGHRFIRSFAGLCLKKLGISLGVAHLWISKFGISKSRKQAELQYPKPRKITVKATIYTVDAIRNPASILRGFLLGASSPWLYILLTTNRLIDASPCYCIKPGPGGR